MIGSTRELGSFMPKDGSFSNRNESQKERLRFVPAPMVGLGRPVSRVEMNAKYAPLTPSFPNRRFPILFLRPKARKRALTKPTLSYMGHLAPSRFRFGAKTERLSHLSLMNDCSDGDRKIKQPAQGVNIRTEGSRSTRLLILSFPTKQHGFHDLPAVGVLDSLQRRSSAQSRNLLVDPGLGLLLHLRIELFHHFWIERRNGLFFLLARRAGALFALRLRDHLLRRLRGCAQMSCVKAYPMPCCF